MSIQAAPRQIADVGMALGRAALFDNRIGEGDAARAAAWAEALAPFKFDRADLLNAVTAHYRAEPQRMITPADLIRLARQGRQDQAMRRESTEREQRGITSGLTPLAAIEVGPGMSINADGPPAPGAYEVNGAVGRPCPHCHAEPMTPCINPRSGDPRKMPCPSRMKVSVQ